MPHIKTVNIKKAVDRGGWDEDSDEVPVESLTQEQAQALRTRIRLVLPRWVIAVQALVGLAVAALCWGVSGRMEIGGSALYGAAATVVPSFVMAWGTGRWAGAGPAIGIVRFMAWEGLKVLLAVAMLLFASRVVPQLSWPALLLTLAVCMNVGWLAPLLRR